MTETNTRPEVEPTDPSILPQWKGHPVPWVTRWTNEVARESIAVTRIGNRVQIGYASGPENHDAAGCLWPREGTMRGGEPEFSQVSAYRQRTAMLKRKCQVCGRKIPPGLINWLMHPRQLEVTQAGDTVTMSPPTCDSCIPLALKLCPALKKEHQIVKVLEYEPWGVSGNIVYIDEFRRTQQSRNVLIEYDRPEYNYGCVAAKQIVVKFTKFMPVTP